MDLVKIGFIVTANGLKEANAEVDKLLNRVDKIGTSSKKNASEFENSQKKIKKTTEDSTKANDTNTKSVDRVTKALERQRLIGEYLGKGLDKTTASAIANFKQLGGTTQQINTLMASLANNQGLVQAQKDAAKLARDQAKAAEDLAKNKQKMLAAEEAARQKKFAAVQKEYQQQMELLARQTAAQKAAAQKVIDDAEAMRVKNMQARQKEYQQNMELLARQTAAQKAAAQKAVDDAEKARQKKFAAVQKEYQQNMERLARHTAAEKAAQEKSVQAAEKARQLRFAAAQRYYHQQMELMAREAAAQEKERQRQLAAAERQRQAGSRGQSGASTSRDVLGQIKGIAAYALLSTAIYGAMTATFNLIGATVRLADEYTSTQQRLKLYIKDSETLGQVNTFLAKSAIQNNVGLRENAALYAKLSPAMQRIGANTAATNQVVDAFGKSLRIGGATAMEAASATIQFAQAMASGKLAGDEFRAISEASPRFLKAIADGSGIAAEKLKEMSSAGALTTEVIAKALVKEYHNLTKESESLGYTLEQGTNALKTGFMSLIGEFNEGAGITKYLGSLMADMGVSMIDSAGAAKESGEAFRVWAISNADNINNVVEAFKLLSTVIISRYVAALVIARVESMKTAIGLVSIQVAAASAGRSITFLSGALSLASIAMKGMLAFFGGWVGLALTVAGTVAAYALFNKESEKTTESLRKEGETIEETVAKYKELTAVQRDKALLDERKNVEATTKAYQDKKSALVANVLNMSRSNDMTSLQAQTVSKLGLWYKDGKINLEQLNGAIKNSTFLSQESKDKFTNLASGVSEADKKATAAEKVMKALALATKGAGDEADIAGSKFDKFLQDTQSATKINLDAAGYMRKYGLDQAKAVELAKQDLALRQQGKYATLGHVKALQEQQASEETLSDITKSRTKADKEAAKSRKDAAKDLKKFNDQLLESQTYYDILKRTNNLEVARIASQKEYINVYKDNLAVATQIAAIQENTRKEESRQEYSKSLKSQIEQLDVIAGLTAEGADYETAKALAAAGFVNDSRGRLAAEKAIMNTLTGQKFALADQIDEQEVLNKYLKDGMGIEEARFKVALSRIAMLSKGKHTFNDLGETFEIGMKELREKKALEAHELKLTALRRESKLLSEAIALGYEASSIASVKLAAATQELGLSEAVVQLQKQEELDLLYENTKARVKINSLLSGESEILRAVKDDYATIIDSEAERVALQRQALKLAEDYNNRMKEQKANPLGDFSKVDFEVFGSFGNPFKEALDGLNSFVSGVSDLDQKIKTARESARQYQVEAELANLNDQTLKAEKLLELANKQVAVEQDLQKQKAETNDIAYGQGLKFAKSFFKEESKGYKIINALEMALQAKKIAFALWEKKDNLSLLAAKVSGYAKDAIAFMSNAATKLSAQMGLNLAQAQGAVAASANAPPPFGFASAAAMVALLAGIGIAIGGGISSGSFAPTNEGKGTVFGDKDAESESVKKSIEILSDNSELMLPLTSAMLSSLRNIESSIGGVANLVIRNATGSKLFVGVNQGFQMNGMGKALSNPMVGSMGGMIGGGILGGMAGTAISGAMGVGAISGALGMVAGPIGIAVGAILGSALGKALGGLFGTKTTIKGQGLFGSSQDLGGILSQGFNLQEYVDVQTKKKTFGITTKTKNNTKFGEADGVLEKQFTSIFSGFYDSILASANSLGASTEDVKKKLQDSVVDLGKIDLKGLNGEQIQERLEAVFGAAADNLAQQGFAGLDDFQQVGEGYYETLIRVASSLEQAQYYTDQLNVSAIKYTDVINKQGDVALEIVRQSVLADAAQKRYAEAHYNFFKGLSQGKGSHVIGQFQNDLKKVVGGFEDMISSFSGTASELVSFVQQLRELQVSLALTWKDSKYLTQTMIQGAGGIQALSEGFSSYYDMLSAQEQATHLTAQMTEKFRELGEDLPVSIQGYKDLLSSQEVLTSSGQKLYGQLIALAPEFTDLQSALKRAEDEANALKKEAEDLAEAERKAAEEATKYAATLAKIRQEMFVTKQNGDYLSEAMIKAAGGTDELSKGLQAYFSMLTPAQQATELTRRMTEQFDALGKTLPSSVDAFRLMIEGLNITTSSGQELYGQLIALAPEFNTLQSSIKAAEDAERNRLEEIARAQQEAAEAAAKAAEEARELANKWDELRTKMFVTKQSGENLSQIMIDAAGGIDKLSSGLDAYFEMLSPQEKAIELTRRLTAQFNDIGKILPSGVEAFRNLISSIDVTTDEGKKLYGQVIALAPEFNTLQDALSSSANEVNDLVKSLRDLADEARKARGEQDKPQNLNITRWQFEQAAMKAMLGDVDAAQQLLTLGKDLMEISSVYASSSEDYARDLAWIQRAATISADVQESGLGYTSTTLSTSLSSGNTTPTLATTSSSTDTEIKGLREDLNAALLAIAKYTQSTATKLENWDDGDRMTVRIEQYGSNDKIPVSTA